MTNEQNINNIAAGNNGGQEDAMRFKQGFLCNGNCRKVFDDCLKGYETNPFPVPWPADKLLDTGEPGKEDTPKKE